MRRLLLMVLLLSQVYSASLLVPAVTQDGSGIIAKLVCEINPGKGRVLVATEPLVGINTQESEKTAAKVASTLLGKDLSSSDVIFIFEANGTKSIDGGSAGAAMTLCLISEITGEKPNAKVSITGTIEKDGAIGRIGGVLAKAKAISEKSSVFLIPKGQSILSTYSKKYYSPRPGVYIDEVYPLTINVTEYAEKNLGLRVVEVSNISEAKKWIFSSENFSKEKLNIMIPIMPEDLPRMQKLADYEVSRAENAVKTFNSTLSRGLLNKAIGSPGGYPYTQANYAFLTYVSATRQSNGVSTIANELKKQFSKVDTSDPYWRGESEMRLSWALFNKEATPAKKEWLMLSAKMLSLENFTGEVIEIDWVKNKANQEILQAKDGLERAKSTGAGISEADKSLELAIQSFNSEMYFAALYNALDSIAWSQASEASPFKIYSDILNSTRFKNEFSEAYRRHAIYLAANHELKGAAFSLYRAQLRKDVFKKSPFSLPSFRMPSLSMKWILAFILVYLLISRKGSKKKPAKLNQTELMILSESKANAAKLLQKKLTEGEINENTYYKLLKELGE